MAITLFNDGYVDYYRITRTWNDKMTEIQKYVRIGKTKKLKKAALIEAKKIDERLTQCQQACAHRKKLTGEIYFRKNGQIVGISRLFHKNGKPKNKFEHVFKVRYNPRNGLPIRYTSINIDTNGLQSAWEVAIDKYCHFAKIDNKSPIKRLMLKSIKYYQFDPTLKINKNKTENLPHLKKRLCVDYNAPQTDLGRGTLNKIEETLTKELEKFCMNI